jgi:hypothetical protein
MEVDEEKFFLMVVEPSSGGIPQRSCVQRGKPRPINGGLRYMPSSPLGVYNPLLTLTLIIKFYPRFMGTYSPRAYYSYRALTYTIS